MNLLFDTNPAIRFTDGFLRTVQSTPSLHPEPIIVPDTAADGYAVAMYGTVLREGGVFRAWYQAMPIDYEAKDNISHVAYAESQDGIHWKKPVLGLVDIGHGPNNICDMALHCPSLFLDPAGPPEARYRATGFMQRSYRPDLPEHLTQGYYSAYSADGLHWRLDEKRLWDSAIGDVLTSIYHPGQDRGIVALKDSVRVNGLRRRSIDIAEFRGAEFSERHAALYPDEFDDVCANARGYRSADYYGMGMLPAGQGTVGFLWKFWHEAPYGSLYSPNGTANVGLFGPSDISLVYQAEPGAKWFHMPGRPDFISNQDLPWTHGWVYSSSTPVEVGDEQRLYYSGRPYFHAYELDDKWQVQPEYRERIRNQKGTGITFASWPKWRLFGYESPRDGSLTLDLGVLGEPVEMRVNFTTAYGGFLRAEVPGQVGRDIKDFRAMERESLSAPLTWKTGTTILPQGQNRVHVKIYLANATLWAYDVATS